MEPLVSIITPAFNASKYLVSFFESVLDQEYSNYELIFINDGSTDDTEEIALQYKKIFEEKGADMILLDIKMPEMNGIDALKEIRKKNSQIPVIMQSAYAFENDMEAARAAGCNGFITKPINIVELKRTISKFLPQITWWKP